MELTILNLRDSIEFIENLSNEEDSGFHYQLILKEELIISCKKNKYYFGNVIALVGINNNISMQFLNTYDMPAEIRDKITSIDPKKDFDFDAICDDWEEFEGVLGWDSLALKIEALKIIFEYIKNE